MPLEHDQFWHMAAHQQFESGRSAVNSLNGVTGAVTLLGANGLVITVNLTTGEITLTEDTHVETLNGLANVVTLAGANGLTVGVSGQTITLTEDTHVQLLNALSGAVSLLAGAGITVGVSGQNITITNTDGAGGLTASRPIVISGGVISWNPNANFSANGYQITSLCLENLTGNPSGTNGRIFYFHDATHPAIRYYNEVYSWLDLASIRGDLGGTGDSPTVASVGGKTASEIANVVDLAVTSANAPLSISGNTISHNTSGVSAATYKSSYNTAIDADGHITSITEARGTTLPGSPSNLQPYYNTTTNREMVYHSSLFNGPSAGWYQANAGATDSFVRADSATTLGQSDGGSWWNALKGTWGISSNQGYSASDTDADIALLGTATPDQVAQVDVSGTIAAATNYRVPYLVVRALDVNNFIYAYLFNAQWNLAKNDGGAFSFLSQGATTTTNGTTYTLCVACQGLALKFYSNGTLLTTYTLSSNDSKYAMYTKAGIRLQRSGSPGTNARFANFYVRGY